MDLAKLIAETENKIMDTNKLNNNYKLKLAQDDSNSCLSGLLIRFWAKTMEKKMEHKFCQCNECKKDIFAKGYVHSSDCCVHNQPEDENAKCNCDKVKIDVLDIIDEKIIAVGEDCEGRESTYWRQCGLHDAKEIIKLSQNSIKVDSQFDEVIINGKKYEPNKTELSYEWIVKTAFNNDREDYTVTFRYTKEAGSFGVKEGTLIAGDCIDQKDGLIINVADTGRS